MPSAASPHESPDGGTGIDEPFDFLAVLEAAREHEPESLERLFRRFYAKVERMVHFSLANDLRRNRPWLAARFSTGDIVQEVFRSVLTDLAAFAGTNEGAFAGYLAMIVRNRILDVIRFHEAAQRDGRRPSYRISDTDVPSSKDDPYWRASSDEELVRFHTALEEFSERDRLLIRARLERSASFEELTERLGYSSVSVARRTFYAAQAKLATQFSAELPGERTQEPS